MKSLLPFLGDKDEVYGYSGQWNYDKEDHDVMVDPATGIDSMKVCQINRDKNWALNTHPVKTPHGPNPWKHSFAKHIREYVGRDVWDSYKTFAFTRNPFDAYVSFYFHLKNRTTQPKWKGGAKTWNLVRESKSFHRFVTQHFKLNLKEDNSINEVTYDPLWGHKGSDYITDENGKVIVDYIGKFENLGFDFGYLCRSIELPRFQLLWENGSERTEEQKPYRPLYGKKSKEIIEHLHKDDIIRFNYTW